MNGAPDAGCKAAAITRDEAISILTPYVGKDLRPIASEQRI